MFLNQAKQIIYQSIVKEGILASANAVDNYARVWSRDSMMTGFVGLLLKDETIIEGLKNSIETLAQHQSKNGQIPSNVVNGKVSYGSLVGRVDATTWWLITTCEFLKFKNDSSLKEKYLPNVKKALECLQRWEFNDRGLIYTPLGGNWADEYITSGYTLYDNVLRYWALKNVADVYQIKEWETLARETKHLIQTNFRKNTSENSKYHPFAFEKASEKPYFWASLNANGYDERFDMAGNALAILLDFELDLPSFSKYLKGLHQEFNHWMLPVFYPIVKPEDEDWKLLENNYNYNFKNKPYHFHNGGAWPIFLGWLSYALKQKGETEIPSAILNNYQSILNEKGVDFTEYYTSNQLSPEGTKALCFSASGYLLMNL